MKKIIGTVLVLLCFITLFSGCHFFKSCAMDDSNSREKHIPEKFGMPEGLWFYKGNTKALSNGSQETELLTSLHIDGKEIPREEFEISVYTYLTKAKCILYILKAQEHIYLYRYNYAENEGELVYDFGISHAKEFITPGGFQEIAGGRILVQVNLHEGMETTDTIFVLLNADGMLLLDGLDDIEVACGHIYRMEKAFDPVEGYQRFLFTYEINGELKSVYLDSLYENNFDRTEILFVEDFAFLNKNDNWTVIELATGEIYWDEELWGYQVVSWIFEENKLYGIFRSRHSREAAFVEIEGKEIKILYKFQEVYTKTQIIMFDWYAFRNKINNTEEYYLWNAETGEMQEVTQEAFNEATAGGSSDSLWSAEVGGYRFTVTYEHWSTRIFVWGTSGTIYFLMREKDGVAECMQYADVPFEFDDVYIA